MNIPWIVRHSALAEGRVKNEFMTGLHRLLSALPRSAEEIDAAFGMGFLRKGFLDRLAALAEFLRSVEEQDGCR